ncbi:MAG: PD-(D/E)XK nuclease family protein [candidate division WOR-3 bacterium]
MNRQLLLAPFDAPDASDQLLSAILATSVEPQQILYLCPSPRKLRDAQVRFARTIERAAFVPPRFLTLFELARALHEEFGNTRRFRAELAPLLVQRLLAQSSSIGYCSAVARFIRDLKLSAAAEDLQATRRIVAQLLDPCDKPKSRALQALDVLQSWDAVLKEKGWSDDEEILARAASWAAAAGPIRLLVLDRFVAPSTLELRLIASLLARAEAAIALCYGTTDDNPAYRLGVGFTRFLKQQGFSVTHLASGPTRPPPTLLCFSSPEDEVIGICRHIKQQYLDGRLDLAKTVVAFPALEQMAPLASRTFREYGIPATVYPARNLAASPPIVAVLELLAALETGFERTATTAAFSSEFLPGLLCLSSDQDGMPRAAAAADLNRAACAAGIIKGRNYWWHLAELLEPEHGFRDEEEQQFARNLEQRVRQAIGLIEKFISKPARLGDFARRLKRLLQAAGFCRDLAPDDPETRRLLEDRGELYDILDALADFETDFGTSATSLTEFTRTLVWLIGLSRRTPERVPCGVLVLSLSETLGLAPEHLYIGGLTEPSLPSRYPLDPILPDSVRRRLGLPDIDWHRDHERFHFERTRNCSRSTPWLSYHTAAEAKLVLPTPFLDLEPKPAQPGPGILSPEEEQRFAGLSAGQTLPRTSRPVDFIEDKDVLAALRKRFGTERRLSVTALERFRACPYCFYLSDVLGLEPLELPEPGIEPRLYGNVVHRALARLYHKGPVPLEQLKQRALECLDDAIAEAGLDQFWAEVTRRLFENSIDDIIECEAGLRAEGFSPAGTEITLAGPAGPDVEVKGRIDRYDAGGRRLRVLDYKTGSSGRVTARDVVEARTHLQLPVYSHLLKAAKPGTTIDNMGIYMTRAAKVFWLASDDYPVDMLVRTALDNVAAIARAIRAGGFAPAPANEKLCKDCPPAFLCGRKKPEQD